MAIRNSLAVRNCTRKPFRTLMLTVLSMLLCFSVLGGSLIVSGLRSGLNSLETRLGADIMVVPYEASTKANLSDMILQGNPGYFYMNDAIVEKLSSMEGVGQLSEQFFLASASSSCCSYKVQIIGFDPMTDFTILPWVQLSYKSQINDMEVFVGHSLNAFAGDELKFYGTTVRVAARLDQTGTYLDTAVYANENTIKKMIAAAKESQIYDFGEVDPEKIVSCVLINVADGYTVEEVLNDINLHVRGVEAVQTQNMISDISGKLAGVSEIAGALVAAIWILVLIILILSFSLISNERKKEFAILRVIGASRKKLALVLLEENLLIGALGSVLGAILAVLTAVLFSGFIENALGLPFLLPNTDKLAAIIFCAILSSVLASAMTAAACAYRISRINAALILRGDN